MKADRPVSEGTASGNDRADFAMVFYECDARGEGVRWQGDCTRLLGHAATEMPLDLSGWLALIHPDDQAAVRQAWTHRVTGQGPIHLEYRVRCRDGRYLAVSDESTAHRDRGVIGVLAARRPPRWLDGPFRHFIETTPLGVLVVGRDGTIGVVNRSALALFGYREEELFGQPIEILLPESFRQQHVALRDGYFKQPSLRLLAGRELSGRHKSGRVVPVAIGLNPILDGDETRVVCSLLDLSDLKRAEQELVRFFDLSPDLFGIASFDGHFRRVNANFTRVLGYSAEELLRRPFLDFVHPDDLSASQAQVQRAIEGETVLQFRNRLRAAQGGYRWFEWSAQPVREEQVLFCVGRDVTERVEMEQRLRAREERERAILDNTTAVIYVKDVAERYEFVNRQYARLLARPREQVVGRTDHDLFAAPVADRLQENDRRVLQSCETLQFEETATFADGMRTYVSVKVPLYDDHGQVSSVASISTDITDRLRARETEQELRLAQIVQQKLYPAHAPQLAELDVAGSVVPVSQMCGDYFDYIFHGDGRLTLAVGDVSGHGFGPALQMVEVRALVRLLLQESRELPELMEYLNHLLHADLPEASFISLFLADIDLASGQLTYAGAGHAAHLLRADGTPLDLPSTGPLLSIDADVCFDRVPPLQLHPGDLLVLCTDGLTEVMSPAKEQFGTCRLLEALARHRGESAGVIMERLCGEALAFAEGRPLNDDMTVIVARVQSFAGRTEPPRQRTPWRYGGGA